MFFLNSDVVEILIWDPQFKKQIIRQYKLSSDMADIAKNSTGPIEITALQSTYDDCRMIQTMGN